MTWTIRRTVTAGLLALVAALAAVPAASAEQAAGVLNVDGNVLVTFDTTTPSTFTSTRPVVGLQPGEQLQAIDDRFTPAPGAAASAGMLYGLGVVHGVTDTVRLYRIDPGTGVAALVGPPITGLPASAKWDIDFDPVSDRLRVVNTADLNMRIDPDSGALVARDTDLNPAGSGVGAIASGTFASGSSFTWGLAGALDQVVALGGLVDPADATTGAFAAVGGFGFASTGVATLTADFGPRDANPDLSQRGYATASSAAAPAGLYQLTFAGTALQPLGTLAASLRALAILPASGVRFEATQATVTEGGTATIAVVRSGSASGTASVAYATADGTATSAAAADPPSDYAPGSGVLTFAPGETRKAFTVQTVADSVHEHDETVLLSLHAPSAPLTLADPHAATLTIADDDGPALRLTGVPRTLSLKALLRRGMRVTAQSDEPVRLTFTLLARTRLAQVSVRRGDVVLAATSLRQVAAGPRSVTLKPLRRHLGTPRRAFSLRLAVTATAGARESRTLVREIHVTVPRRHRRHANALRLRARTLVARGSVTVPRRR